MQGEPPALHGAIGLALTLLGAAAAGLTSKTVLEGPAEAPPVIGRRASEGSADAGPRTSQTR